MPLLLTAGRGPGEEAAIMRPSDVASACSLILAVGCGVSPEEAELGDTPVEAMTPVVAAASITPTITFFQGWNRIIDGNLVAGGQVRVHYEALRLSGCRGTTSTGGPAWSITANAQIDGGPVQSTIIAGHNPDGSAPPLSTDYGDAVFTIPASSSAGELALWFQITNRWGCTQYDSDFGRNFRYPIAASSTATLRFAGDWSETLTGRLTAGGTVNIDYALSRLPSCRQGYNGFATWDILAHSRFDGGASTWVTVTRPNGAERLPVLTPISIPAGARELEIWFSSSDRGGCRQYDSDFGANYRFAISGR
jgi:hypothetical protein